MNFYFNTVFVYYLSDGTMLLPGNNVFTKEKADQLLKNPDVQERIKMGQIKVSTDAVFEEIKETKDEEQF
jgi:hypothetical protein